MESRGAKMEDDGFTIVAKGSKRCAHGNRGKGPRYSPSSSAALGADDASLEDAKQAVARGMELLEVRRRPPRGARLRMRPRALSVWLRRGTRIASCASHALLTRILRLHAPVTSCAGLRLAGLGLGAGGKACRQHAAAKRLVIAGQRKR